MYYQNGLGANGERDCEERWEVIKPELPKEGAVMDIGSSESYFGKRIADETNLLSISVEGDKRRTQFAKTWMEQGGYQGKTVLCDYSFNGDMAKQIAETCEWIDCVMLLSVLHWMPDHKAVVSNLAKCSGKMIIELPNYDPNNHIMKDIPDARKYLEETTGRTVRHLASVAAHKNAVGSIGSAGAESKDTREIWIVEGDLERNPQRAYFGCDERKDLYKQIYKDGKLEFVIKGKEGEKKDWIPGVNCMTLSKLNTIFPKGKSWSEWALNDTDVIGKAPKDVDTCIWNLIAVRGGTKWIDLHGSAPSEGREQIEKRFEKGNG